MKPCIYLSGAITHNPNYKQDFAQAQEQLEKAGYEVVNPAEVYSSLPKSFIHEQYMAICLALLKECDTLCLIDTQPIVSEGMTQEIEHTLDVGMEIYSVEELLGRCTK